MVACVVARKDQDVRLAALGTAITLHLEIGAGRV